jgi:hypothetical protein
MKICMIGKFPPIQGGVSARTFWLVKGLVKKDITIHMVTNANCVEREYYIDDRSAALPENVIIHDIQSEIPWHIPDSKLYISGLLEKALEVVDENHIDIIESNFLVPYGIVGFMLSGMTNIPHVVRHGGSDIEKFLKVGVFSRTLKDTIRKAAVIISDDRNRKIFDNINPNVHAIPRYVPDEKNFKPGIHPHKLPVFAYIGKINHFWKHKSLDKIVEIFSGIKNKYVLRFVGQGKGFKEFSKYINKIALKTYLFENFIHPVNMPDLLSQTDFLIRFEANDPVKDISNIVSEALLAGTAIITDRYMDIDEYTKYIRITSKKQVVRIDLKDLKNSQEKINSLIDNWQGPKRYNPEVVYGYDRYIEDNFRIYAGILA